MKSRDPLSPSEMPLVLKHIEMWPYPLQMLFWANGQTFPQTLQNVVESLPRVEDVIGTDFIWIKTGDVI